LGIIITGIIFARGRKTVTSWFRAAGITQRYKAFYYFIGSIGRKAETITTVLLSVICDRSDSPWDDSSRRSSHADRCAGLRRQVLKKTFFEISCADRKTRKIVRQFYKLMKLAA